MKTKSLRNKRADLIGWICLAVIILCFVIDGVSFAMSKVAGASNATVPAEAKTLTGTADGRNGPVAVEVKATENRIYRIRVTEEGETKGIGNRAYGKILPAVIANQTLRVDAVSGATITSNAVKSAIANALENGGMNLAKFGAGPIKADAVAKKVPTGSGITVIRATEWAETYPDIYASYLQNEENKDRTDYVADFPMIKTLYDGFGFAKYYDSARGHFYCVSDVTATGRPHALANCFTCKTPDFTVKVNNMGDAAYKLAFEDVLRDVNENLSCYNCHANEPGEITVTHTYLSDAIGGDFASVDAANLSCGQCHVEYYFDPVTKATTLPYTSLATMNPDDILHFYNTELLVDGKPFSDYTNPGSGIRQLKVQHPEFETYLGAGSVHRNTYSCADCHMGTLTAADGTTYPNHYLTSPLANDALIANTCAKCHTDLKSYVAGIQKKTVKRTTEVGETLVGLQEKLKAVAENGTKTEAELERIRSVLRDAQFYWDFVFVENSNGAHNSKLTNECLDKAEALATEASGLF